MKNFDRTDASEYLNLVKTFDGLIILKHLAGCCNCELRVVRDLTNYYVLFRCDPFSPATNDKGYSRVYKVAGTNPL